MDDIVYTFYRRHVSTKGTLPENTIATTGLFFDVVGSRPEHTESTERYFRCVYPMMSNLKGLEQIARQVVREHLDLFYPEIEDGISKSFVPPFDSRSIRRGSGIVKIRTEPLKPLEQRTVDRVVDDELAVYAAQIDEKLERAFAEPPEGSITDIDLVARGTKDPNEKTFRDILSRGPLPYAVVLAIASQHGIGKAEARKSMEKLARVGTIYNPSGDSDY